MKPQLPSFLALFTFLLLVFMAWRMWKKSKSPSQNLPPGPWKLPLIGNIHQMVNSLPHHRLRDLAKEYGPIMHLQLGEVATIVCSSPQTAKEIMQTHDIIFAQRPFLLTENIITYCSTGVAFAPYGDYWRQLRKICILELLSAKRVRSFQSIREEEVSNLIGSISYRTGLLVNISSMLFSVSHCITARAAFGKKCKDQEAFILAIGEVLKMVGGFSLADLYPSSKLVRVISVTLRKLKKLHKELDRTLENIINEHKACRVDTGKIGSADGEAEDLVHLLLNLQDHGNLGIPLTTDNIKAVLLDMFTGGSETSSTALEWAMSELIKNPKVMEKAQREVRQVFDGKGNVVNETGLEELNYLKLVIKETLRLHPPLPLILPRECREPCSINGYDIPVKTKVIVNVWAIGRDPTYWIEADRFWPERFVDSGIDYKGTNFEFLPFGAGRRMCPGILFGIANLMLPLAQLLYYFDWKLPKGTKNEGVDMTEEFGTTVRRKNDLHLIPVLHHQSFAS